MNLEAGPRHGQILSQKTKTKQKPSQPNTHIGRAGPAAQVCKSRLCLKTPKSKNKNRVGMSIPTTSTPHTKKVIVSVEAAETAKMSNPLQSTRKGV